MNPSDIVILVVVALVVIAGVTRFVGSARGKRDCCSGAKRSDASAGSRVVVADHNEEHYPYTVDLKVEGMHCEHCVAAVEDAFNGLGEVWATADLAQGTAHVRSKEPLDATACIQAVERAGYTAQATA